MKRGSVIGIVNMLSITDALFLTVCSLVRSIRAFMNG